MDDLLGLDWNNNSSSQKQPNQPTPSIPALRPSQTPTLSGRSTPGILRPSSTSSSQPSLKIGSKPTTPANDSFASLLGGTPKAQGNTLSLQERQRQLLEEKAKAASAWDGLGGRSSPLNPQANVRPIVQRPNKADKDDILAAFNSPAPVDRKTHFPPPQNGNTTKLGDIGFSDDDDTFGLQRFAGKQAAAPVKQAQTDDDDILGMLGRPVEEVRKAKPTPQPAYEPESEESENEGPLSPEDKAVAELVDMGFPANQAAIALARTESGLNVQAAVGILLKDAHDEAKRKAEGRGGEREDPTERRRDDAVPPWARGGDDSRGSSRSRDQSTIGRDKKDATQIASELGTSLFKSANSLWKTGQKKVQKAVAEFQQQQEGDSSQPKWMRDAQADARAAGRTTIPDEMTNEAMLLESKEEKPVLRRRPEQQRNPASQDRMVQPLPSRPDRRDTSSPSLASNSRSASRLTRNELETSQEAYISPARRRKPQPTSEPLREDLIQPSLPSRQKSPLASPPIPANNNPFSNGTSRQPPKPVSKPVSKSSTPTPRSQAPPRRIPSVSPTTLSSSAAQRKAGSEAFKRGDFTEAHTAYTAALSPLPPSHPVVVVVLSNRALTNLKVGDPKAAIRDAEMVLQIIGISRGEGEKIALGPGEGEKEMKEFYGKALMRKAEALEHLEKWKDAASLWRLAVEVGAGGNVSIQGRNRCEKASEGGPWAAAPKQAARAKPPAPKPKPKMSAAAQMLGTPSGGDSDAVKRLREANKAADKADDEKYALMDIVDSKIALWKGTNEDNLRALLGSLDKILWESVGWKKVGMHELLQPKKVKMIYFQAVSKLHPDKVCQNTNSDFWYKLTALRLE
jgi:hypothetical protein